MAMYTDLFIDVDFKKNTPDSIIFLLKAISGDESFKERLSEDSSKFTRIFRRNSLSFPNTACAILSFNEDEGQYSLIAKGTVNNSCGVIESFIELISPHIDNYFNEFIGFKRGEQEFEPTLIYVRDNTF